MNISVCPIKRSYLMEQEQCQNNVAAILCSSYPIDEKKVSRISQKLILSFNDTINMRDPRVYRLELAEQVLAFVAALDRQTELYICCDSGESRSAAIAAAVHRYTRQDEMMIWKDPHYCPNPLVYSDTVPGVRGAGFTILCEISHMAEPQSIFKSDKGSTQRIGTIRFGVQ